MTALIIALATAAALASLLLALGLALSIPATRQAGAAPDADGAPLPGEEPLSLWRIVLLPGWQRLQRRVVRYLPQNVVATYSARLAGAGSPYALSGALFLVLKLVVLLAALVGGVLAGALLTLQGQRGVWPITLTFALFVGFLLPDAWLSIRRRAYVAAVRRMLPSTIDLLLVAIEAGLTFDRAVAYAVTTMQGALVTELNHYLVQRRLGASMNEALDLVAQRVRERDVSRFTDLVAQSQQHGLPMSDALSAFAADLRQRRRQEATEHAQQAVIKMLFPMVVFILPAMFIIVLAPALAHLSGSLKP